MPVIQNQHQPYDRSSKWLIQHHGDSMLWLANVKNIRAWRPAQAELVQPRRLPDGLLEVCLEGENEEEPYLLEVTTYPERRVSQQMTDGLLLVYLDRGQLPEGVTLVLRPKGKYRVPRSRNLHSRHGFSSCRLKWRVVELWTIPAEELLRAGDVGLIPWVPLTILGGKNVMLEIPFLDEIVMEKTRETARKTACETSQQNIVTFLSARFGDVPPDVIEGIESIDDQTELRDLVRLAASCPDLATFREAVVQDQRVPKPAKGARA
jgi:hypothetical protein